MFASDNSQSESANADVTDVIDSSGDTQGVSSTDPAPRPRIEAEQIEAFLESEKREQARDREPFFDHSYPHEAIHSLRSSESARERIDAARTLGVVGNLLTTPHLIAALFDQAPEVRRAAAEALERLRDPDVAIGSLESFLGAGSDLRMQAETLAAPLTASDEESLTTEGEPWERAKGERHLLEYAPEMPTDSALWDLPPATVADLYSADSSKRASALFEVARSGVPGSFSVITRSFDDPSSDVRNAAALALSELEPQRTAEFFGQALETASPERCHNIGDAMVASGLAADAINNLAGENRERAYNALCMLFLMAKLSVVEPLAHAIEVHQSIVVRSAAMRILTLSGQPEVAEAAVKRRLGF